LAFVIERNPTKLTADKRRGCAEIFHRKTVQQTRQESSAYRGRLAPSPTGYLHLGHALRERGILPEELRRASLQ
jgi:hypothetical protein